MEQMYRNNIKRKTSTVYNYVGLTNRPDLVANLSRLSPKAISIVIHCLANMQERPFVEPEDMCGMMLVRFDWEALGMKDSGYRSRILKELLAINFFTKYRANDYLINLHYINPFSRLQHEGFVRMIQMAKYKR